MAGIDYRYLDPFLMLDHMGEVDYAAGEAKGTDWHPHRGFETVTYMIEGPFIHQDTTGGGGLIADEGWVPGWMTAGAEMPAYRAATGAPGRPAAGCSTASSSG